MQKALTEKEELLVEKENNLKEMKVKLEKLQHEIENSIRQQSTQDILPSKPEIETGQEHKEQELLEKIQLLQNQSAELKQSFDSERRKLLKQNEEEKEEDREIIEKLKEKLENEKLVLTAKVLDKEREVEKLRKDMDEMRDNIRVFEVSKMFLILLKANFFRLLTIFLSGYAPNPSNTSYYAN
jgi:hypothetical protein